MVGDHTMGVGGGGPGTCNAHPYRILSICFRLRIFDGYAEQPILHATVRVLVQKAASKAFVAPVTWGHGQDTAISDRTKRNDSIFQTATQHKVNVEKQKTKKREQYILVTSNNSLPLHIISFTDQQSENFKYDKLVNSQKPCLQSRWHSLRALAPQSCWSAKKNVTMYYCQPWCNYWQQ